MPKRMSGKVTGPGKGSKFEGDVSIALERLKEEGLVRKHYRIATPKVMTPKGVRYTEKVLADHCGWTHSGRIILIEAKNLSGKSCPFVPEGKSGTGLKEHQMWNLIDSAESGGVGLLVVQFAVHGVWQIDGRALRQWWDGGDEANNGSSISLKHFGAWGKCLGDAGHWNFERKDFE